MAIEADYNRTAQKRQVNEIAATQPENSHVGRFMHGVLMFIGKRCHSLQVIGSILYLASILISECM